MASFQIIVGSMLGTTEYVAEACEETLIELGHSATVHLTPCFDEIPSKDQTWIICTSTHGAGDYPDNIQSFIYDLENSTDDLTHIPFCVIGIGDSNYDTFCMAAKNIKNTLITKGCNEIIELLTIDMDQDLDPELVSQEWISDHNDRLSQTY